MSSFVVPSLTRRANWFQPPSATRRWPDVARRCIPATYVLDHARGRRSPCGVLDSSAAATVAPMVPHHSSPACSIANGLKPVRPRRRPNVTLRRPLVVTPKAATPSATPHPPIAARLRTGRITDSTALQHASTSPWRVPRPPDAPTATRVPDCLAYGEPLRRPDTAGCVVVTPRLGRRLASASRPPTSRTTAARRYGGSTVPGLPLMKPLLGGRQALAGPLAEHVRRAATSRVDRTCRRTARGRFSRSYEPCRWRGRRCVSRPRALERATRSSGSRGRG